MTNRPRNRKADGALVRALEFLDQTPLVDGHNDLAYLIRRHAKGNVADYDLCRRRKKRD
jgi:membrane dipeptidase